MDPPVCVLVFARMQGSRRERVREMARNDVIRFVDSYASLLVLLIANFLLLQIVDDARWVPLGDAEAELSYDRDVRVLRSIGKG